MIALYLGIGVVAGVLSGLFGIGGGVVIVPLLIWLAKMAPRPAVGTSLGALLLPVGILGVHTYWRGGNVDVKASVCLAIGLLGGVLIGARVAQHIDGVVIQRAFAVLMVLLAIKVWLGAPEAAKRATPSATTESPSR
jgi:uncharacterized membrane protein YfcA